MKRFFKIFGITLASFVGVVIVAASIAVWVVFTPERLTPIARQVADKFITCEYELGEVDLTFFSTFPEFGLRADGICLVNPMSDAQSDTLLSAPKVVATVNVADFLVRKNLTIREVSLTDMNANIFINSKGEGNFDVFVTSPDSTEEDTTAFSLPFNEICVRSLAVEANQLTFVDEKDTIDASLSHTEIKAKVESWDDIRLNLGSQDICANVKGTQFANHLCLKMVLPMSADLETMHFELEDASLAVNEFEIALAGKADIHDTIHLDAHLETEEWQIEPLLALLPSQITESLKDIKVNGKIHLDADAKGQFGEGVMPLIDANVTLKDGEADYKPLPYHLRDIQLVAAAHLDLNDDKASYVDLTSLSAKTKNTQVEAKGNVTELLADMLLDLHLKLDANIPDFDYFLPKTMVLDGRTKGAVDAKIRLSDLTNMRLEKGRITGDLTLKDIDFKMDSMLAKLPMTTLTFAIPNTQPSRKKTGWLSATIGLDQLSYEMIDALQVRMGETTLKVETDNLINGNPVLTANVSLTSSEPLTARMDSMAGTIKSPSITAYAEYDTKDTTHIPVLQAQVSFDALDGYYTDIKGVLAKSTIKASISGGRRDKSIPRLSASIHSDRVEAAMGSDIAINTQKIAIDASAHYNKNGENVLLKWNPTLKFDLHSAVADLSSFTQQIKIPQITFSYSNKDFKISQSQIILGNSDFSLTGEVKNMGNWMRKKGILEGELNFVSDHTDANELMALISADEGSEETTTTASIQDEQPVSHEEKEANPFLVPTSVDLTLNTHIKEAVIFNEVAHNLGGRLYMKNGTLVLEEMGFICNAAKLQLTAMYRTPRRNHIYLGMDYHMLDIDIRELISMIPQLDTMMPMLQSFAGKAEFHLAAETYLNAQYEPKLSTLRGACSLFGKDLVVLDNETFSTISKLLMFKKKTENKVDSISAEITLYKNEIDIYPFTVSIDNYMAALGGRHNLDMSFDYHISLLSPLYIGVDVKGTFDDLQIKAAKCKYAQDFKPLFHHDVDTQSAELRKTIRESMRKNVKIQ